MSVKKAGLSILQIVLLTTVITVNVWAISPLLFNIVAKQKAYRASSLSNLKQLGNACSQYVQDYDGEMPDTRAGTGTPTPSKQQIVRFMTAKPDYNLPADLNPGYAQAILPYLTNSSTLFSPADTKQNTVSYWWKYAIDKSAVSRGTVSVSDMKAPEKSVFLYENSPYSTGRIHGIMNGLKVLVAFVDGHVEEVTIKNGPTSYPLSTEQNNGEASMRLGSPMFFNCRNGTQHSGVADYDNPLTDTDVF